LTLVELVDDLRLLDGLDLVHQLEETSADRHTHDDALMRREEEAIEEEQTKTSDSVSIEGITSEGVRR
jgi:hypothetical protein